MRRLGAIAVAAALLLAACSADERKPAVDSYQVDPAGTTLTLVVVARPGSTARAEVATQDSDRVVVKVRVREPGGSGTDLGQHYPVTVTLKEPLGKRPVVTDYGQEIPTAAPTPSS